MLMDRSSDAVTVTVAVRLAWNPDVWLAVADVVTVAVSRSASARR